MYCSACGKQIADSSLFCPYCGNRYASEMFQPPQPVTPQAAAPAAAEPVSYGFRQSAPVQPYNESGYTPNYAPESSIPQQSYGYAYQQGYYPQNNTLQQSYSPQQNYVPQRTVSQQSYGQSAYQGYEEPAKNVKDFAQRFLGKSSTGLIITASVFLYIDAGINALIGIVAENPLVFLVVLAFLGLGIWLKLTYSIAPAIISTVLGAFTVLIVFVSGRKFSGWTILVAGIIALIATIPIRQKYNRYKQGMFNTNNNYQVPQQGYAYAPGQNYNAPGTSQPPQQDYYAPDNAQPPQQNYYTQNNAQPPSRIITIAE